MDTQSINKILDDINADRSVPRNIRTAVEQAKTDLNNDKHDPTVRISSAISILDEVSNDPNIPMYTRTQIWNVVSMLEIMNEEVKEK
ncbi:MAG: UPF0147 family protein [Candidatus Aenigmarchaeota archaeon]|nr:UPF0147 family protein [Candidatus Aenigmarchaeota archaeon]